MPPLLLIPLLAAPGAVDEAPVGFVVHPHAALYEELAATPANAEIANVFLWRMADQDQEIPDFEWAETWLERLYKSGRTAYPILDTSVFHSGAPWRQAKTAAAGQNLVDFAGNTRPISSLFSPIFRQSVFNYVDQLIAWTGENDPEGRVAGYLNGAEWFMPGTVDYSPLAFEAFRPWLAERYGGLDELNAAWGAGFGEWGEVEPPRGYLLGDDYVGLRTAGFVPLDLAWISPRFEVTGGQRYRISAGSLQIGVPAGLCALRLVCYDANANRIAYYGDGQFIWNKGLDGQWVELELVTQTPPNAVEAEFRMRLAGPGYAEFRTPSCQTWPGGEELLPGPEDADAWRLENGGWRPEGGPATQELTPAAAERLAQSGRPQAPGGGVPSGQAGFHLASTRGPLPCEHAARAWNDWITFCYEAMAGWLNDCAVHIQERDPSRPVVSYLGSVFGTHCIPDFNMYWQRADISLANSPDIDVNGIQMCIAGDDVTYATHLVDIARKYGKPIYATDLVDFPYGLYSGFEAIYRGTLAAAQHGMDGVFWYTWREAIPNFSEYSYSVMLTGAQQERLIGDTKKAIAALEGYELRTGVALVLPVVAQSIAMPTGYGGDVLNRAGWYHLLVDAGFTPDIYTPYELEQRGPGALNGYDVVVLPDAYMLPKKAHAAIKAYEEAGGKLVADGTPPTLDLAGQPLATSGGDPAVSSEASRYASETDLANAMDGLLRGGLGGKLIGRAYWGPVRRWRVDGNTPPPFMQLGVSSEERLRRVAARKLVSEMLGGVTDAPRLLPGGKRTHMAVWTNEGGATDVKLFLVHLGEGRTHPQQVALPPEFRGHTAEAWLDFDRREDGTIEEGVLTVPGFSHAAIVHLTPGEDG